MATNLSDELREAALAYHRARKPGKLEIRATKPLASQRDLALAYSPGVAAVCEAIADGMESKRASRPSGLMMLMPSIDSVVQLIGAPRKLM